MDGQNGMCKDPEERSGRKVSETKATCGVLGSQEETGMGDRGVGNKSQPQNLGRTEWPGQMRKPRFREEQHCLPDDSIQKGGGAGPGVRAVRRGHSQVAHRGADAGRSLAGSCDRALIIYKAASQQASVFPQPGLAQLMNSQPWETSQQPLFIKPGTEG